MGMQSAMMNIARTLGFAMGPTLAALVWSPDNRFAADGMRKVFYVLLSVQLLTLLSIAGYRTTKVSTVKGSRHPAYQRGELKRQFCSVSERPDYGIIKIGCSIRQRSDVGWMCGKRFEPEEASAK